MKRGFCLTRKKWEILRSKVSTSKFKTGSGGRRYLPYAFTEQEIYMPMTVLKGELAIKQNKALIRTFRQMILTALQKNFNSFVQNLLNVSIK